MDRAGPLVYVGFFTLIAYSLSAGNAGTAFRYRMHIVALAICLLVVLRELRTAPGPRAGAGPGASEGACASQAEACRRLDGQLSLYGELQ